jgi:hypothetical protein
MSEILIEKGPDFFCSLESRGIAEDLVGSAPRADYWFMLEYDRKWGKKAFAESSIFGELADFHQKIEALERSRLLLVKQDGPQHEGGSFFVALSKNNDPEMFRFPFSDYTDLNDLDIADIIRSPEKYKKFKVDEPIYFVCTNGLRDKCCARNGVPVYQVLSEILGEQVWQSTHHGGHRFSANMLKMPLALSFGQLDMGNPREILREIAKGLIPARHFRGRTTLSQVGQAAEMLTMNAMENWSERAYSVDSIAQDDDNAWVAQVSDRNTDANIEVRINRLEQDNMMYVSCVGEKQAPQVQYELISIAPAT